MDSTELTATPSDTPKGVAPLLGKSDPATRARREHRRKRLRHVRRAALGLLLIAGGVGAALALRPKPVPVDVTQVKRGSLVVAIEEAGMTRVKDRFAVSAPVTGNISRVALEPGDHVHVGDVLAQIAPVQSPLLDRRTRAQADAQVGSARSALGRARSETLRAVAALEQAQRDLARSRQLLATGALSAQALSQSEFDVRLREQEHASSVFAEKVAGEQLRLAYASTGRDLQAGGDLHVDVLAPVEGTVLRVTQKSAGVVQIGSPLFEIGDPRSLEVVVDLLTTDAVHVHAGTVVHIAGFGTDDMLAGEVRRVEPSAFTRPSALGVDEQRVNVLISFTAPPERWAALGDGYRVEARLELWRAIDVLQAPHGAVFKHGNEWATFVVEGGRARRVPIQIAHRGEDMVEVVAGLIEGSSIAVHPGDRVQDGVAVLQR